MAGAQAVSTRRRRQDPLCKYSMFQSRLEGKIPCLGLGSNCIANINRADQGTVTGVAFQKVGDGVIKPAIDISEFREVVWTNSSLINRNNRIKTYIDLDANAPPQQIPGEWTEFTVLMRNLYEQFLAGLNSQLLADQQQTNVYEALRKSDLSSPDVLEIRQTVIQRLANLNLALHCSEFAEFIDNFLSGFVQDAGGVSQVLFKMFHNQLSNLLNFKVAQSPRMSDSRSSHEGVVHCLTYSATRDQPEVLEAEDDAARTGEPVHGRLRHKVLNRKRTDSRSPSSERSNSPELAGVENFCENISQRLDQTLTLHDVLNNLTNVEISSQYHHLFVEPHNADLYVSKVINTQSHKGTKTVIVVEVASDEKSCNSRYDRYLEDNVEKLIQELFAAISYLQTCISGMLIVPDGIVLVEVVFENNAYIVKETELVLWSQTNKLLQALNYFRQKLISA